MRRFLSSSLSIFALLLTAQIAQAQVFYTQEFSGGMPAGWTTTDASNQGVVWEWCAGPSSSCVELYGAPEFVSTSVGNGFMVLDSDEAGQLPNNHKSRLTSSAINCSAANQVFIVYETYIGVYTNPSTNNVTLQVSSDNVNWTAFPVIDGLEGDVFSDNQVIIQTDISSVAANKPTVYLRWEWNGKYEYWWFLDDVRLTSENPTPANDLSLGEFFYPPSSFATPESQIATDTFGFYGYVTNNGTATQTDVTLKAEVLDEDGNVLFTTSETIASLEPGYVDTFIVLPDQYAPELGLGVYSVVYSVTSAEGDERPNDNDDGDFFVITDATFSKENAPTSASQPDGGGDYTVANLYTMSAGSLDTYKAAGLQFSAATNPGVSLPGIAVVAYMFKVNDDVDDNWGNFDDTQLFSSSLEWLGDANYTFPAGAANFDLQSVELLDASSGAAGIPLENGARYLAAIGYIGAANNVAFHSFDDEIVHYFVSSPVFTDKWYLNGFGLDFNPVVRMVIELATISDKTPLQESVMTVFPNPVKDVLNLDIQFDAPTDATITIAEANGRVIKIDNRKGLSNEIVTYQLPQLAPGTYLARIATAEGTKTKKFVVVK